MTLAMWPYHPDLLATPVPRYTSFPTAAEFGVYGPEGEWLIEGHGVEPDIVVDNLPHATFNGGDAQLEAAIRNLQDRIRREPVVIPPPPTHPDLSIPENRK